LPTSIGSGAPREKSQNLPSRWPSSSVARSLEPAKAFLAPGAALEDPRSISRANGLANRRSCRASFTPSVRCCCAFGNATPRRFLAATAIATGSRRRPGGRIVRGLSERSWSSRKRALKCSAPSTEGVAGDGEQTMSAGATRRHLWRPNHGFPGGEAAAEWARRWVRWPASRGCRLAF
jgi:hypothetical protein